MSQPTSISTDKGSYVLQSVRADSIRMRQVATVFIEAFSNMTIAIGQLGQRLQDWAALVSMTPEQTLGYLDGWSYMEDGEIGQYAPFGD